MNINWMLQLQFFLLVSVSTHIHSEKVKKSECISRDFGHDGTVCVCNATYCDELESLYKLEAPNYQKFTSNKDGLRMKRTTGVFENDTLKTSDYIEVKVDADEKFQTIFGYGGAFTDSFGINVKHLSQQAQNKLLSSYFSKEGIEYNVGRVPIGGSDFSTVGYSYDDSDVEDPTLNNFRLRNEDFEYKIPLIKKALVLNEQLKLFASAWTAPKWMKTNNAYDNGGSIKNNFYQTWADYFKRFLDEYNKQNVTFWGITTGNEPFVYKFIPAIPSVAWTSETMQKWIGNNLGPTIRNSAEYKDLKIMLLDDQRIHLREFVDQLFQNETVKNYVDMIAVHWYTDHFVPPDILDEMHNKYPDKLLIATEASIGDQKGELHTALGSWNRGERYAYDIIEDMQHHCVGWVDWNMALDPTGGPTYINNQLDSPVIVNATSDEFYRQPMFYVLGHFSKFVPRDSIRIDVSSNNNSVPTTAFLRPDNGIVVILQNRHENAIKVGIVDKHRGQIKLSLSGRSLTTIVYY